MFNNDQKLSAGSCDEYFAMTKVASKYNIPRQLSAEDTDPKRSQFTINFCSMEQIPTNMTKTTAATKTKVADCEDEHAAIEPKTALPGHKGRKKISSKAQSKARSSRKLAQNLTLVENLDAPKITNSESKLKVIKLRTDPNDQNIVSAKDLTTVSEGGIDLDDKSVSDAS